MTPILIYSPIHCGKGLLDWFVYRLLDWNCLFATARGTILEKLRVERFGFKNKKMEKASIWTVWYNLIPYMAVTEPEEFKEVLKTFGENPDYVFLESKIKDLKFIKDESVKKIFVFRDPRIAWYLQNDFVRTNSSIEAYYKQYLERVTMLKQAKGHLFLKFENMINKPYESMAEICKYLEVDDRTIELPFTRYNKYFTMIDKKKYFDHTLFSLSLINEKFREINEYLNYKIELTREEMFKEE